MHVHPHVTSRSAGAEFTCVLSVCPPPPGEELFFSAGHHGQLAPVALRADPGRRLAGLDLLLTGSRVPHVRSPAGNSVCTSLSAKLEPPGSSCQPARGETSLPLCPPRRLPGVGAEGGEGWDVGPEARLRQVSQGQRGEGWTLGPRPSHPWGGQGVRGFAVGVPGAQASSGGWELAALWGCGGRAHGPCAALPAGLAGEARVSASSAVTWGRAASETGAGTGTARAAPRATWTACSWATSTSTSTRPPL